MQHLGNEVIRKLPLIMAAFVAALLTAALCTAPLAAFADDGEAAVSFLNESDIDKTDDGACGLLADAGITVIANALNVQTKGNQAAAVSTSAADSVVSITNSQLSTKGSEAPLLSSTGTLEADNVQGTAEKSPIASIVEEGSMLVANSTLESAYAGDSKGTLPTSAIVLYRTSTVDATTSQRATALFQATESALKSAISSGSFFYVTNTKASIALSGNTLDFDANKVKLLTVVGSDITSGIASSKSGSSFGAAGKNGATVTFTARNQKLEGDVEVDSISSTSFFLLDGSTWKGACDITANAAGADLADNITVNVDATSGWIVTKNSTVSSLNIEKGGKLVDENGKAVAIVDADGNTLVDGASDIEVTVADDFTTTVKTTDANKLQVSAIDRTDFDEEFGTATAFGANGSSSAKTDEERAAELQAIIVEWFRGL